MIRDRFWDGLAWRIDITDIEPDTQLTFHVAPITTESVIDLDESVRARLAAVGRFCNVSTIDRVISSRWTETVV